MAQPESNMFHIYIYTHTHTYIYVCMYEMYKYIYVYIYIYIERERVYKALLISFVSFPGSSAGKESACNAGDPGSIPGSGRSSGEGIVSPSPLLGLPSWLSP